MFEDCAAQSTVTPVTFMEQLHKDYVSDTNRILKLLDALAVKLEPVIEGEPGNLSVEETDKVVKSHFPQTGLITTLRSMIAAQKEIMQKLEILSQKVKI